MDASMLKSTRGRAALKPSKALRRALRARGKQPGNITFLFGPKADSHWIVSSDIELAATLRVDSDPSIVWYDLEAARVTAELARDEFKGFVPDLIFQRFRGQRGMIEAKSTAAANRGAVMQQCEQSRYAEEIGYAWELFSEEDAERMRVRLMNWLSVCSVLLECRHIDVADLMHRIESVVADKKNCTLLEIRSELVSGWHMAFVAVMRLHMKRRVVVDLEQPLSWNTVVTPDGTETLRGQSPPVLVATDASATPGQYGYSDQQLRESAPRVRIHHLPPNEQSRYAQREAAIDLYFSGVKPARIRQEYGITRQELHQFKKRFFLRLDDGSILGYHGLLPCSHMKEYTREKPALITNEGAANGWGYSGALGKCFRDHPKAMQAVHAAAKGKFGDSVRAAGLDLRAIHRTFLDVLRKEVVLPNEWPFCVESMGYASLAKYVNKLVRSDPEVRQNKFGTSALDLQDGLSGKRSWLRSLFPCDIACYDEQQLPWIGTIRIEYEGQEYSVPADRCSLCLLSAERPHVILAYYVSYRRRVAAADMLATFTVLLRKWTPRVLKLVPGLRYMQGAGFPSMIEGFLENARLVLLKVDNDLTHSARVVVEFLRHHLGLHIQFGKEGRWITRIIVEQVFNELQRRFGAVPSTTGSGPNDPKVRNPAAVAVRLDIRLEELLELFEVVTANWNATPRNELNGATPLEVVRRECARFAEQGSAIPGLRPSVLRSLPLPVNVVAVFIRANPKNSLAPHVHMDDANYSADWLKVRHDLVDRKLIAHLQHDHRLMRLFTLEGRELGMVVATGHWSWTSHDRATRKTIIEMKPELRYGAHDDPVQMYGEYLKKKMKERARTRPTKVAKEANKLARIGADLTKTATGTVVVQEEVGTLRSIPPPPPRSRGAAWLTLLRPGGERGR